MMKRLISATLALSLLGVSAASARSWNSGRHGDYRSHYSYSHGWNGDRRYHNNGASTALGISLGLFALAAIASSQRDDRYYDYAPPPPPPPAYRGGYYGY